MFNSFLSSSSSSDASSSMGFSFGSSAFGSASSPSSFGSSSGPVFSFTLGGAGALPASNPAPHAGFSFGSSASCSASSPSSFGLSSGPVFSFTLGGARAPPASNPAPHAGFPFGLPSPAVGFGSSTLANDQMNDVNMTDVNMTYDTNQSASALFQSFAQRATPLSPPSQPYVSGSPAIQPGVLPAFQFASHQNPAAPQNPSPFQSAGNVEFTRGSFFLCGKSDGGKSGRKFLKIRRDKHRKK